MGFFDRELERDKPKAKPKLDKQWQKRRPPNPSRYGTVTSDDRLDDPPKRGDRRTPVKR